MSLVRALAAMLALAVLLALALSQAAGADEPPEPEPEPLTAAERAEARAIYVRVRGRVARSFLPGVTRRPVPKLLFRDTASGGAVHAGIVGRDVLALPPLQRRLVSGDRDQIRRAKHVLIHELAHLEQRGYLWPERYEFSWPLWKREGGARAFAKIVSRRWYGDFYLSGAKPEYERYAAAVLERLGRRWVMKGQFRKP